MLDQLIKAIQTAIDNSDTDDDGKEYAELDTITMIKIRKQLIDYKTLSRSHETPNTDIQ